MGVCRRGSRSDGPSGPPTHTLVCALVLFGVATVLLVIAAISLRPEPTADGVRLTPEADLSAEETLSALPSSPTSAPSLGARRAPTSITQPTTPPSDANAGGSGDSAAVVAPVRAPLMAFFRGDAL